MGRKPRHVLDLDLSFDEALERFLQVDPSELPDGSKATRSKGKSRSRNTGKSTETQMERKKVSGEKRGTRRKRPG